MDDDQAGEHEGAAGEVARGEALVEDQVAGEGGEDGFEAHDNRRVGGPEVRWQITREVKATPVSKISRTRQIDRRAGLCYYLGEI